VFLECCKRGIVWQGIVHDWYKFLPSEWFPYVSQFGGGIQTGRNKTGYYKPEDTGNLAFEIAWLQHQRRSKHHWQSWCVPIAEGKVKAYDMPMKYRLEMVADWHGAGRAQHKPKVYDWWVDNKAKMVFHPDTSAWLEEASKQFTGAPA
jgi:hypothetical protein